MIDVKPVAFSLFVGFGAMFALAPLQASERPSHFIPQPSDTLTQAVANFSEYNARLEKALQSELDANTLYEIHQLTYTLEVALKKIDDELSALADVLEELHVATEKNDAETARVKGRDYLEISRQVIK